MPTHRGAPPGNSANKLATEKPAPGQVLYRGASEGPLRVLGATVVVFALGGAMLAGMMLDSTVHISHHITFNERIAWAGSLMLTFLGLLVATWMYSRRLATGIDLSADGAQLHVHTPTLTGTQVREVPLSALGGSSFFEGDVRGQQAIAPPYVWVRVQGDRSFVVPLAGHIPNRARLMRALAGQRPS